MTSYTLINRFCFSLNQCFLFFCKNSHRHASPSVFAFVISLDFVSGLKIICRLCNNNLHSEAALIIGGWLSSLSRLRHLDLSRCTLTTLITALAKYLALCSHVYRKRSAWLVYATYEWKAAGVSPIQYYELVFVRGQADTKVPLPVLPAYHFTFPLFGRGRAHLCHTKLKKSVKEANSPK